MTNLESLIGESVRKVYNRFVHPDAKFQRDDGTIVEKPPEYILGPFHNFEDLDAAYRTLIKFVDTRQEFEDNDHLNQLVMHQFDSNRNYAQDKNIDIRELFCGTDVSIGDDIYLTPGVYLSNVFLYYAPIGEGTVVQ